MTDNVLAHDDTSVATAELDRRSQERQSCGRSSLIRLLARPSFQSLTAVVQDVTSEGLGLILGTKLEPGTVLALQLQGRRRGASCVVSARVMHTTQRSDGNWHVGCKFSARLRPEELQALLDMGVGTKEEEALAGKQNRRAWVRYHCTPDSPCHAVETRLDTGVCTALVHDISKSGVSLVLNRHLKVGAFLAVELVNASQVSLPPLLVRVIHATAQANGDWLMGCEFATELTRDEIDVIIS